MIFDDFFISCECWSCQPKLYDPLVKNLFYIETIIKVNKHYKEFIRGTKTKKLYISKTLSFGLDNRKKGVLIPEINIVFENNKESIIRKVKEIPIIFKDGFFRENNDYKCLRNKLLMSNILVYILLVLVFINTIILLI